jgi:PhnB protein
MPKAFKPAGYPDVSPYLVVEGAAQTIAFLEKVFGAKEIRRFPGPEGRIGHAEIRLGDSVLMLGDSAPTWAKRPASVHIYVPDVDETYRRALEAGATSVQAPAKKDDADRRAGVRDSGGTTWWIGTKID